MKNKYVFYTTIFFLMTGVSQAGETGGYVGLGFGATDSGAKAKDLANFCFDNTEQCTVDNSSQSFQVQGGYNVTPNFAVEAAYTDLGTVTSFESSTISAEQDTKGISVSAVGKMPVGTRAKVYGKAGVFHWKSDVNARDTIGNTLSSDSDGTDPVVGVGVDYQISPNWSARIGWDRYFSIGDKKPILNDQLDTTSALDTDVDVFSVGINYDF